jgi:multidrug efflux pump subunit AcrB
MQGFYSGFFSPFRIVIVFMALTAVGFALVPELSVDFKPPRQEPQLQISFSGRKTSPEVIERTLTSPLENALSQVSGLKRISSRTGESSGAITLEFEKEADINFKKFEVSSIIRNIYPKLPEGVSYPIIEQFGGNDNERDVRTPFLIYTINAPYAPFQIRKEVEEIIRKPLVLIPEIEEVEIGGVLGLQLTVSLDLAQLIQYRIDVSDVSGAIARTTGSEFPGMATMAGNQQYFLRIDKELADIEELENIILGTYEGKNITIRDVGKVYLEEQEPRGYFRIDGKNAITMQITPREGVNKVVIADLVKKEVEAAKRLLPEGYNIFLQKDESEFLNKELNKIYKRTGLSILILTVFIFLASRNPRYLLTIFAGLIVNISLASILVYFLEVNINLYSLAGVAISFGLIMDNAIVMVDHLHRKRNARIFLALLAASLTTIMALLAVLILPEELQYNLIDFAKVVAIMLGVSLVVALFFTPALYFLLFKEQVNRSRSLSFSTLRKKAGRFRSYSGLIAWLALRRKWVAFFTLWLFGFPIFFLPSRWEGQEWYNKTLGNETYLEHVRPWVDKISGGALRMFVKGAYERFSYRDPEQSRLIVSSSLPYGSTLEQMNTIIKTFEDFLLGYEGVKMFTTSVSSTPSARIEIIFDERYEMTGVPYMLKGELVARSLDWSGANWNVYGVGQAFSQSNNSNSIPSYRVEMWGYNFDELEKQAEIMAEKLLAHRRIQEVNINAISGYYFQGERVLEEYILTFDPSRLASHGYNQGEIIRMLKNLSKVTSPSGTVELEEDLLPVYVKTIGSDNFSKFQLMEDALPLDTARLIRVKDLARLEFEKVPNIIHKENRQYKRVVAFDYYGSNKFGAEYRDQILEEMAQIMPVGYVAKTQGYNWYGRQAEKTQYGLIAILILGIFIISAILFENLRQPLLIAFSIPVSFIGLFLIFSLGDFSYDQGGYAAFLLLGGLVVNASIFILNDYNNSLIRNQHRRVVKAVIGKSIPIILTVVSTCLGLVPFLLEGDKEVFWFGLAIGTIGGLVFSLYAVFVLVPVFLSDVKVLREKRKQKRLALQAGLGQEE